MEFLKTKILQFAEKTASFTTRDVLFFLGKKYSRQYIVGILSRLVEEGSLKKTGKTRQARYWHEAKFEKGEFFFKKRYVNKKLEEHIIFQKIESEFSLLKEVSENVHSILVYAFSEMFNNAIEHSRSKSINVEVLKTENRFRFVVRDFGIGVFRNIKNKKKLKSELEAIRELMKGKVTTMPKSHSGEGIFFTSKVVDLFELNSYGYQLKADNDVDDIFVKELERSVRGTEVVFEIDLKHKGHLNDVFEEYYSDLEELAFDKTKVRIKLYTMGTIYISRSQARRVLSGLEKFKKVILDFDKVPTVGQAFADEVFRVFKISHPEVEITSVNMNKAVEFMIGRVGKV